MATRIQLRRDTLENWELTNPILGDGEIVIVKTNGIRKKKIGDGVSKFNEIEYDELENYNINTFSYVIASRIFG